MLSLDPESRILATKKKNGCTTLVRKGKGHPSRYHTPHTPAAFCGCLFRFASLRRGDTIARRALLYICGFTYQRKIYWDVVQRGRAVQRNKLLTTLSALRTVVFGSPTLSFFFSLTHCFISILVSFFHFYYYSTTHKHTNTNTHSHTRLQLRFFFFLKRISLLRYSLC